MTENSTITLKKETDIRDVGQKRPRTSTIDYVKQFARTCIQLKGINSDPCLIAN